MSRLIINNVGPIKHVDINLNKINVFIGPQSSGKSTIAKIVSFCSWLEKRGDVADKSFANGAQQELEKFHHMQGYFTDDSSILYIGENIKFALNCADLLLKQTSDRKSVV